MIVAEMNSPFFSVLHLLNLNNEINRVRPAFHLLSFVRNVILQSFFPVLYSDAED